MKTITEAGIRVWQACSRLPEHQPMYGYQDDQACKAYATLLQEWSLTTLAFSEAWAAFAAARADKQDYITAWSAQWAALCLLPQLFIAV